MFASEPAGSGIDGPDLAIRDASNYLNSSIPERSTRLILNIQPDFSNYISEQFYKFFRIYVLRSKISFIIQRHAHVKKGKSVFL